MLTIYRGNRAELLAELLATQLRLDPPDPFSTVEVVVNTWPTSRWLGEQLAIQLGGVAANLRFPFPGSHLRRIVAAILAEGPEQAADPWRADRLVWAVLACLPAVAATPQGEPLRRWLRDRDPERQLSLDSWRLARAIADAFDDYTLYRSDLLQAWERGQDQANGSPALAASQRWQPLLYRALRQQLGREPFGLKVERAIACLASRASGGPSARAAEQGSLGAGIVPPLRLFGLSSLAPVQVRLLQAVSGIAAVELFLLTPCPDLWQRCTDRRQRLRDGLALNDPLSSDWLLEAPGLEARFGRLGAEFQQLLEGSGEAQLGETREANLFLLPATAAASGAADPGGEISGAPLLLQLQEQLADPQRGGRLRRWEGDHSLEFHACPGPLRQVQILRDRLLQLLAADPSLEPRDILVMTPQVDRFAPLVAAVLGDSGATGVSLPWRLTDRSQQGEGGIGRCLLTLLEQAGERLTATGLEAILECAPLRQRFGLSAEEGNRLSTALQRCGFRWGLDGRARAGESTHSLAWAIDRLLLGLVLPASPGLALGDPATAPASDEAPLELTGRWLHLLTRLRPWLAQLGRPATVEAWVERLRSLLLDLFADGGDGAAELPVLLAALDSWQEDAGASPLTLEAPVVAAVLQESLGAESGRFGHRSGALTISALEPMRAIPHRVIVLMGLDAGCFPRNGDRAGFHLMEQQRRLGDPQPADQDRYALLEALLSARRNLLVSWSCRDDRKGEALPPAAPVRQWLDWLEANLDGGLGPLLVQHAASPLERTNFLSAAGRPPASCDRRWLEVRRQLDSAGASPLPPLIRRPMPQPAAAVPSQQPSSEEDPFTDLRAWLMEPQRHWLRQLGLRPAERERSVEDLEALALAERERVGLLRAVEGQADAPASAAAWLEHSRGQGVLPPRSAGLLEARRLQARRSSLAAAAADLGPAWSAPLAWGPWQAECRGQGDAVVLVHLAKAGPAQKLELWLLLLLASAQTAAPTGGQAAGQAAAEGRRPSRGVVLCRDKDDLFGVTTTLLAPPPAAARQELERLQLLRQQWRSACWPVPPQTGWAWWEEERKLEGSGFAKARDCWEGRGDRGGERQRPEMAVCFGADLPTASLLDARCRSLAAELFEPLLQALPKPQRRSRSSTTSPAQGGSSPGAGGCAPGGPGPGEDPGAAAEQGR
jgi:exodeoxyribonuclease V gamma subunit